MLDGLRGCIQAVGDVDNDGHDDIVIATRGDRDEAVYVLSGKDGSVLHTLRPTRTQTPPLGRALAAAGDVDRDGHPDILVASHFGRRKTYNKRSKKERWVRYPGVAELAPGLSGHAPGGSVYVFSGRDGSVIHKITDSSELFGFTLAGGRDIDGDSVPDICVSAPSALGGRGLVLVYSGETGERIGCFYPVAGAAVTYGPVPLLSDLGDTGVINFGITIAVTPPVGEADRCLLLAGALAPENPGPGLFESFESPKGDALAYILAAETEPEIKRIAVSSAMTNHSPHPWEIRPFDAANVAGWGFIVTCMDGWLRVYDGMGDLAYHYSAENPAITSAFATIDVLHDLNDDGRIDFLVGANEPHGGFFDEGWYQVWLSAPQPQEEDSSTYFRARYERYDAGVDVSVIGDADSDGRQDFAIAIMEPFELRIISGRDFSVLFRIDMSEFPRLIPR